MVKEFISQLPPDKLSPFAKHPYQVREDAAMDELVESVRTYGILSPLLARPKGEGYELVSGHRRRLAAQKLGLPTVPVLVREMSDDEAVILMVDSNLQRENLLPSEKAFAYKMKLEAMNRQGRRTDLTSTTVVPKFRSNEVIGKESGESRETVRRYIRLTNLVPPLLQMVDDGRIAFSPAVELSYLTRDEQAELWDLIGREDATPSLSQSLRRKQLSREAKLTPEVLYAILTEEKPNQKEQIRIKTESLRKYFPRNYSAQQMEREIIKLLEARYRAKDRGERCFSHTGAIQISPVQCWQKGESFMEQNLPPLPPVIFENGLYYELRGEQYYPCLLPPEADTTEDKLLETIIRQMAEAQGIDEDLKARDQMVWVGAMNNIKSAALEILRESQ